MFAEFFTSLGSMVPVSPMFYVIGLTAIFLTAVSKGAFGGGLPIIVPILALTVDPITAAIIAAPLLVLMDVFALRSFGLGNASRPDLRVLLPGLLAGLGVGWALFELVDHRIVTLTIAVITLLFVVHWFFRTRLQKAVAVGAGMPANALLGFVAGTATGFTTFISHAGGPPIMMYLLRRGLEKSLFAGTMILFFLIANVIKLVPFGFLMKDAPNTIVMALVLAPAVPFGVWVGKAIHDRLDQQAIFLWSHIILLFVGGKMLFDALRAFA